MIGPVAQYYQNSKYYSAIPPPAPPKGFQEYLPHITIQMPVYKESLEQTITPSVESLKKAMHTYARQGGTSSIMVNDDGLQLLEEEERDARIKFYANHDIGWVARPPHGHEGFIRAGRFKKASNMNYGLSLSLRMEEILCELEADSAQNPFGGGDDEVDLAERALAMAVDETKGQAWAKGGRALRMGEIILIVDSDTKVPEDCFRDAARELAESPEVAIIQHESDGESHPISPTTCSIDTPLQSCRSPTTSSRTASRTLPSASTTVSPSHVPMVKSHRSSDTMRKVFF